PGGPRAVSAHARRDPKHFGAAAAESEGLASPYEAPVAAGLLEAQLDPARQQRLAKAERDGRDVDDPLAPETGIRELPCQVPAPDDPEIPPARSRAHLRVDRRDVRARELDRCTRDEGELPVREGPAG